MNDTEIRKEKIRNLITPDVLVCKGCRDTYKELTTCAICDTNMLNPDYKGMAYECPICAKLYCEKCWNKAGGHKKESKGILH